jgi:hypothetical protein
MKRLEDHRVGIDLGRLDRPGGGASSLSTALPGGLTIGSKPPTTSSNP